MEPGRPRPEHDLLLGATGAGGTAQAVIDRALSAKLDWTLVTTLALQHRMTPALLAALDAADPAQVPGDVLDALRRHCHELREQSRVLVGELFGLLDALDRRRVTAIPFKGPLLGELLFGDMGWRPPGDLDILIRPDCVGDVCAVLEERGYVDADLKPGARRLTDVQRRMYERVQCEYQFVREADDTVVEPHWDLSQRPLALDVDYCGMLDRARPVSLGGRTVPALAPADLLLALCVHGSKHHWERLAWVRDVAAVLTKFPELDLDEAVARAGQRGCARLLLVSLAVAREVASVQLPYTVRRMIEADPTVIALRGEVIEKLFAPDREEPRNDRIDGFRFRVRERWADRLRYVGRTLFMPRRHHLELVALPNGLQWAYYPFKIGMDFAIVPIWGVVKPAAHLWQGNR